MRVELGLLREGSVREGGGRFTGLGFLRVILAKMVSASLRSSLYVLLSKGVCPFREGGEWVDLRV